MRGPAVKSAWDDVCDRHLLPYLMQTKEQGRKVLFCLWPLVGALLMIVALAGPTWVRLSVPTYQALQPRVLLLDLSEAMLEKDLVPDRLTRAKFKLHDLLQHKDVGQFGLLAYTGEPFIVSPLTDDGQTIDALLSSLTPDIMPLSGQRLDLALLKAQQLVTEAGFQQGELLVLTGDAPSLAAVKTARILAAQGMRTSILPLERDIPSSPLFSQLAKAGGGFVLSFTDNSADLNQWLTATKRQKTLMEKANDDIPQWRDEGRWFVMLAMLCLLPLFRRGWLQRLIP